MRGRLLLISLLGVMLASAKTYDFTLSSASQAGATKLNAGHYTLKVEGSKITLKDAEGRDVQAPAKVEMSNQKFRDTEVSLSVANGNNKVEWIGLGGSTNKIVFE